MICPKQIAMMSRIGCPSLGDDGHFLIYEKRAVSNWGSLVEAFLARYSFFTILNAGAPLWTHPRADDETRVLRRARQLRV
jgi:hypothetical protein